PRRVADAPPAVGEGFFTEERTETKGRSGGGREGSTNVQQRVAPPPNIKVAPPKLFTSSAPKSDIKQLFAERAKEAASVEAFGSEQISKSGASDAGAILKNIS